jgi:hypothetical protein
MTAPADAAARDAIAKAIQAEQANLHRLEAGSLPKLSNESRAARAPRPPGELIGALQDRIHPTSGRLRAAKAIVVPRRK